MNMQIKIFKIVVIFAFFSLVACSSTQTKLILNDETLPISVRYQDQSKRKIRREWNRVKELIYNRYNTIAKPQDTISCSTERVTGSATRRFRFCTTRKHREEMSEAAKGEFCTHGAGAGMFYGCDSAYGTMNNNLVHERAEMQMRRINMEIINMATYDSYVKELLLKARELEKLYKSK